jgi:hypothetical membrane protein
MKMLSNTPPPRDSREIWKHFSDTYFSLRTGLALLAFAMPFVLYLYGQFGHGLDLQPSMSAYFWAAAKDQCATFPMRTIFVGFLFAIGIGLYVYKGLTRLENSLLNAAALCAALVAIFPERLSLTEAASDQRVAQLFESCPAIKAWATLPSWPIHYMAAVILFVLLAIIAWFCANKSLEFLPTGHDPAKFQRTYRGIAIAMILFPIAGFAASLLFGFRASKVFFIEAAGIVTFGVYWTVKSRELALSQLERDPVEALEHAAQRQDAEAQAVEHGVVNAKT